MRFLGDFYYKPSYEDCFHCFQRGNKLADLPGSKTQDIFRKGEEEIDTLLNLNMEPQLQAQHGAPVLHFFSLSEVYNSYYLEKK